MLLPGFFLATVVMVLAVVALVRIDSPLGDAGVFVLALGFAGILMIAIRRLLDEGTPAGDEPPERSGEGSR